MVTGCVIVIRTTIKLKSKHIKLKELTKQFEGLRPEVFRADRSNRSSKDRLSTDFRAEKCRAFVNSEKNATNR